MFKSAWIWFAGSLATIFIFFRGLVVTKLRFNIQQTEALFGLLQKNGWCFVFEREVVDSVRLPRVYHALCVVSGLFFKFHIQERMLTAGQAGTDSVAEVFLSRNGVSKLLNMLKKEELVKGNRIPIYILQPWDAEKVGEIRIPKEQSKPYLNSDDYNKINSELEKVKSGEIDRSGVILYGPPGNGKSYLIRYFAIKHRLPLYIVSFTPDQDNHSIIRMFSHINGPAILIFEDFDSYFDSRKCLMPDSKLTFDTLLNVLDGCFSTANGLISFMTANDISKIDNALRYRPSRFKYKISIENPDLETRRKILGVNESQVNETDGFSLDDILLINDFMNTGMSFTDAISNVSVRQESD